VLDGLLEHRVGFFSLLLFDQRRRADMPALRRRLEAVGGKGSEERVLDLDHVHMAD
jgi:hypothetical protein